MAADNTPYRQAYSSDIAIAAVKNQRLDALPRFSSTRMTWIKPSWAWMLYRSGYSFKDPGQERILALSLTPAAFFSLLRKATLSTSYAAVDGAGSNDSIRKLADVRVQWAPERSVRLEKLPYRSIQIGVSGALISELVEGTVKIEDVTQKTRELKRVLDEDKEIRVSDLVIRGLMPEEDVLEVDEQSRKTLEMGADISR